MHKIEQQGAAYSYSFVGSQCLLVRRRLYVDFSISEMRLPGFQRGQAASGGMCVKIFKTDADFFFFLRCLRCNVVPASAVRVLRLWLVGRCGVVFFKKSSDCS